MIVVIFVSARAHMRYFRCSLVIYAWAVSFQNVTASAVCALLKSQHFTVILRYRSVPTIFFVFSEGGGAKTEVEREFLVHSP